VRREHRRIEQVLLLLADDPHVEDALLVRFLAEVSAHLVAEGLVYAKLERGCGPLTRIREVDRRVRILVSKLSGAPRAARAVYLHSLDATFREHSLCVEGEALPALEGVLARTELRAQGYRRRARAASSR
jgi:hypothetical protein